MVNFIFLTLYYSSYYLASNFLTSNSSEDSRSQEMWYRVLNEMRNQKLTMKWRIEKDATRFVNIDVKQKTWPEKHSIQWISIDWASCDV